MKKREAYGFICSILYDYSLIIVIFSSAHYRMTIQINRNIQQTIQRRSISFKEVAFFFCPDNYRTNTTMDY